MEKISFNEVVNALSRKGITSRCPMCGHFELKGLREEEYQLLSFSHPDNGNIDVSNITMLPCATVVCLHCGYAAQFVLPALLKQA